MRPFVVNVADLLHRPAARRRERLRGRLNDLRVGAVEVPPGSDLEVDAVLEWVSDGLLATGSISAPWRADCQRCLGPAAGHLDVGFRELFETRPTEGESYRLGHDTADLEPLVREAVMLELPLVPLCRPECEGLCPQCGAELNLGPCSCQPAGGDARWAALDALRDASDTPD